MIADQQFTVQGCEDEFTVLILRLIKSSRVRGAVRVSTNVTYDLNCYILAKLKLMTLGVKNNNCYNTSSNIVIFSLFFL